MTLINKIKTGILALTLSGCGVFTNNFHEAIPRQVYRSGQMSPEDLEETIEEYGIQSVLNLRGGYNQEWHNDERTVCQRNNVEHYTVRMSARRKPRKDEMLQLFEVFDAARLPLQIHCLAGADRTGLAVTAYLLDRNYDYETAMQALNFIPYGHIESEIDEFFEQYRDYRKNRGTLNFREWVKQKYKE